MLERPSYSFGKASNIPDPRIVRYTFNENRKQDIENNIYKILHNKIKNKLICFLGVTFKANTDDLRDSSAVNLISKFGKKGAKINYYEPSGSKEILDKQKNDQCLKFRSEYCSKPSKNWNLARKIRSSE